MSFITKNLKDTLTLWSVSSADIYGNATWTSPTQKKCRWEDRQIEFRDKTGNTLISSAILYVGEDFNVGDYVYLGISGDSSPPTAAHEVKNVQKTPSVRGDKYGWKVILHKTAYGS